MAPIDPLVTIFLSLGTIITLASFGSGWLEGVFNAIFQILGLIFGFYGLYSVFGFFSGWANFLDWSSNPLHLYFYFASIVVGVGSAIILARSIKGLEIPTKMYGFVAIVLAVFVGLEFVSLYDLGQNRLWVYILIFLAPTIGGLIIYGVRRSIAVSRDTIIGIIILSVLSVIGILSVTLFSYQYFLPIMVGSIGVYFLLINNLRPFGYALVTGSGFILLAEAFAPEISEVIYTILMIVTIGVSTKKKRGGFIKTYIEDMTEVCNNDPNDPQCTELCQSNPNLDFCNSE
jgi:hypothetical protein